jgi:hypothetical protein
MLLKTKRSKIRDGKMFGSGIKHPGSATLEKIRYRYLGATIPANRMRQSTWFLLQACGEDSCSISGSSAALRGRRHRFFQRSESTLCLGCPPPDPFATPMAEALPLADQPQLLTPTARREDLFGIPRQQVSSFCNLLVPCISVSELDSLVFAS